MFKKRNIFILLGVAFIFYIAFYAVPVSAIPETFTMVSNGTQSIYYDYTTGAYMGTNLSSGHHTVYKYFNDNGTKREAYCVQLDRWVDDVQYKKSTALSATSREALIIGRVIDIVKRDYYANNKTYEGYLYITEAANAILKLSGYKDYLNTNSKLKAIYNEAVSYVDNTEKRTSSLPKITLTGSQELNSTSTDGTYISNKITLSGLVANYGGGSSTKNGDTTYTVKATGDTGATVVICTDAAGRDCTTNNTKTYSKPNGSVDFYIKVTGGTADGSAKVTVTGSNSSIYSTAVRYDDPNNVYQTVVIGASVSYNRSVSTSLSFDIPGTNKHNITVIKVDEDGNELAGAEMQLFKALKDDATNTSIEVLANNTNGAASFRHSITFSADNDTFFNYKYCVKENTSPSGYLLQDPIACYTPTAGNKKTCLKNSGEVETDLNYCGATYKCSDADAVLNGTNCDKTTHPEVILDCTGKGNFNATSNQCEKEEDPPTVDAGTGNASCPDGQDLVDNKCYTFSDPTQTCPNGTPPSNGVCTVTTSTPATCVNGDETVENKYCVDRDQYTLVTQSGNNLSIMKINNKSSVTISKKSVTGDKEIPGAKLKICSSQPNDSGDCAAIKIKQKGLACPTVGSSEDDAGSDVTNCSYDRTNNERTIDVSWTSTDVPREWKGLEVGRIYYLVETTPPSGYIRATITTQFTINNDGSVTTDSKKIDDGLIVINNQLTHVTISKDDIATSKELPGATLSICESYTDKNGKLQMSVSDDGDCTVVTLADGSSATWVSTDKPHEVVGLPIGTYYLVERTAPNGYSTAESIIFTLKPDGTLADKDGKSLKDSKIVMHDKKIGEVRTGMFGFYVVACIVALGIVGSIFSYIFLNKNNSVAK